MISCPLFTASLSYPIDKLPEQVCIQPSGYTGELRVLSRLLPQLDPPRARHGVHTALHLHTLHPSAKQPPPAHPRTQPPPHGLPHRPLGRLHPLPAQLPARAAWPLGQSPDVAGGHLGDVARGHAHHRPGLSVLSQDSIQIQGRRLIPVQVGLVPTLYI